MCMVRVFFLYVDVRCTVEATPSTFTKRVRAPLEIPVRRRGVSMRLVLRVSREASPGHARRPLLHRADSRAVSGTLGGGFSRGGLLIPGAQ